jgi:hypothetical protein
MVLNPLTRIDIHPQAPIFSFCNIVGQKNEQRRTTKLSEKAIRKCESKRSFKNGIRYTQRWEKFSDTDAEIAVISFQ